jgi:uncharacterized membrane protein YbhN (UPF0104 family)
VSDEDSATSRDGLAGDTTDEPSPAKPWGHVGRWAVRALPYVFVPLLALLLWSDRGDLDRALEASWGDLLAIAALVVAGQVLNATEFWVLYRAAGVRVSFVENQALFNAGQLGNYLPMQAGTFFRLRYLKSVHGLHYANTASYIAMNIAISLASTAFVGLVGVLWVAFDDDRVSWLMASIFVAMLVVSVASARVALPSFLAGRSGRLVDAWHEFHSGWETVRRNPTAGLVVLALDVVKLVLLALRFAIVFRVVGVDASLGVYFVVAPVAALASAVSFTPGSLGFREAAVVAAVRAMGSSIPDGLLGATVDRGVMLVVSAVLGGIGFAISWPRLKRAAGADPRASLRS